jgi:hypothetical protein
MKTITIQGRKFNLKNFRLGRVGFKKAYRSVLQKGTLDKVFDEIQEAINPKPKPKKEEIPKVVKK